MPASGVPDDYVGFRWNLFSPNGSYFKPDSSGCDKLFIQKDWNKRFDASAIRLRSCDG